MLKRLFISFGIYTLVFLFFSLNWARADSKKLTPEELEKAKALYGAHCSQCHGETGRGDGPAAAYVYPRPRDFKRGLYKIKATPSGKIPTDEDLFRVITGGMPGTSMSAWRGLSDEERWLLVYYIKSFSRRLSRARKAPKPITIGEPIPMTEESIQRGKELYDKVECWKCHGEEGKGDGPSAPTLKDKWGFPIRPGNLRKSWNFRGGNRREDIYRNIMVGITGTPMPDFSDSLKEEEIWHLANYMKSLSREKPRLNAVLRSKRINGKLPNEPGDPLWGTTEIVDFPLVGQILVEPRMFTPSIDMVSLRSLYNQEEIAFLITWDDTTKSPRSGDSGEMVSEEFSDAFALEFPTETPVTNVKPHFLMGDKKHQVNIWYWMASTGRVEEKNAKGITRISAQPLQSQQVNPNAWYKKGQWRVLLKRPLTTDDSNDIQFAPGKFIPIAFFAWDGSNGEVGEKMSISSWYDLLLEEPRSLRAFSIPPIVMILIVGFEFWLMRFVRKRQK